MSISSKFSPLMWFLRNIFSYSPHLTERRYSPTLSSSQFLTESGLSSSENSDSVGLANDCCEAAGMVGARRVGATAAGERLEGIVDEPDPSVAGKDALDASIAMMTDASKCHQVYLAAMLNRED